jgi:hypothetical protein
VAIQEFASLQTGLNVFILEDEALRAVKLSSSSIPTWKGRLSFSAIGAPGFSGQQNCLNDSNTPQRFPRRCEDPVQIPQGIGLPRLLVHAASSVEPFSSLDAA